VIVTCAAEIAQNATDEMVVVATLVATVDMAHTRKRKGAQIAPTIPRL